MGSRKFVLTIFFSGGKQTIGAGTTSEVYSTRLTGGRCEATRKRIFALRPFAPHRLPSPPLRHGMAFRFPCMSNSSTRRAHNMATSCTRKEWATAVAADSEVCIGRLGRDEASVREEEAPSLFDLLNHRNR